MKHALSPRIQQGLKIGNIWQRHAFPQHSPHTCHSTYLWDRRPRLVALLRLRCPSSSTLHMTCRSL